MQHHGYMTGCPISIQAAVVLALAQVPFRRANATRITEEEATEGSGCLDLSERGKQ